MLCLDKNNQIFYNLNCFQLLYKSINTEIIKQLVKHHCMFYLSKPTLGKDLAMF